MLGKFLLRCSFIETVHSHADKFDQFWSINQKLMDDSSSGGFRSIPFRLHFPAQDDG